MSALAAGLDAYGNIRRPATSATVLANRRMDQAERVAATNPRAAARSVALGSITDTYRQATGGDVAALNARPSLTTPRRRFSPDGPRC